MSNKVKRTLDKEKMNGYIDQFLSISGMDEDQLIGFCLLKKFKPSLKNKYKMALQLSIAMIEAANEEKEDIDGESTN